MANGDYGGVGGRTRGCFCAGSPRHEYRGGKTARANARAREYSRTRSALYEELDCIWLPLAATILRLPWRLCGQDRL